jgi:hypothetical protein
VAPAAVAVNADDVDLRLWLLGGRRAAVELEEALRFLGALEIAEERLHTRQAPRRPWRTASSPLRAGEGGSSD